MALIVETGTGISNANSFATVAEADTYFAQFSNADWASTSLSTGAKEVALIKGTQYLVLQYTDQWAGSRTYREQALPWPRVDVVDVDGFDISSNEIPDNLKKATFEAALRVVLGDDMLLVDVDTPGAIKSESVTIGPISESVTYVGSKGDQVQYTTVDQYIVGLLQSSSGGFVERG